MLTARATSAAIAAIAACTLYVCGASAFAANADLAPAPRSSAAARKSPPAKADKARRRDRETPHRIHTYKLFRDPVFKLNGAVPDRRLPAPLSLAEPLKPLAAAPASPLLKLQESESSGIAFGCRDKAPAAPPAAPAAGGIRELTACYKHNVDRAWKAQTYVSREVADGSQRWGGGLALRYAY